MCAATRLTDAGSGVCSVDAVSGAFPSSHSLMLVHVSRTVDGMPQAMTKRQSRTALLRTQLSADQPSLDLPNGTPYGYVRNQATQISRAAIPMAKTVHGQRM